MKSRLLIIIGIVVVLIFSFFVINYNNTLDDTPYDIEIQFDAEEYSVNYFVVNGNTDNIEIEIPFDMIDGVFMIYVNDQVVDDERIILNGNKIIVNYGQNIESVKLIGSHDLGGAELQIESNPVFFEGYPQVNQNDRWCSTTWIVHHDTPINTQLIIEKILQKISEYGEMYNVAERKISIKSIDENTSRISVQGVWDRTFENEEPFLTSFMKTFEFVSVEESRVACA